MKSKILLTRLTLIALFITTFAMSASAAGVTGKVVDASGEPLIGVTVVVQGTAIGTATRVDGTYDITAPTAESTLVYSFLGYTDQAIVVGAKSEINVTLATADLQLDEVVVVGYGTQRKRDVTGAITTVDKAAIEERQPVNVYDALQGSSPGVMVATSSTPGDEGSSITIRGASTIEGGSSPLFIVDGVAVDDIDNINPSDIKSMEILKDAASAAIYGSRSANGVIIITTDSGDEGAPRVSVRYLHSFTTVAHTTAMANGDDALGYTESKTDSNYSFIYSGNSDSLLYSYGGNASYQDMLFQTANRDKIEVSMSGGTGKFSYMNSLSFTNQEGTIIYSDNKAITGRLNASYQANDKLKLISKVSYSYNDQNAVAASTVLLTSYRRPNYYILNYPDGEYYYVNAGFTNPIAYAEENYSNTKNYKATIYQGFEYKITPKLMLSGNVNANYSIKRAIAQRPGDLVSSGIATQSDKTTFAQSTSAEGFLTYNNTFNDAHTFNFVAGMSAQSWLSEGMNYSGDNLIAEGIYTTNNIMDVDLSSTYTTATEHALVGLFARLSYSYKGRYLLNATIRRDGSSRFTANKWGTFPSASLGWRFSDEKFMEWAKPVLTDAKFRLSYGQTGNENIGNYESIVSYEFGDYYYNGETGVATGTTMSNPDIKWETTTQINYGLDLTMFEGRVSLGLDYYIKTTDDLLYSSKIPTELGFSTMKVNLGSIENKGYEVVLSVVPVKTKKTRWTTTFGYSTNENTLTELAVDDYISNSVWMVAEGESLGQFYGYTNLGIYAYDESNMYIVTEGADGSTVFGEQLTPVFQRDQYGNVVIDSSGQPSQLLGYTYADGTAVDMDTVTTGQKTYGTTILGGGDRIYEDLDNNGYIDDNDCKILGDGNASGMLSWTNNITYKSWGLSFTFYGSWGNKIYNYISYYCCQNSSSTPDPAIIYDAWKFPGQVTNYTNSTSNENSNRALNSLFLEDGAYIRLRNLRLTYNVNKKFLQKLGLGSAQAYAYGTNLLTWTEYRGFDPELTTSSVINPGYDSGRYPRSREIGLGLNVNF